MVTGFALRSKIPRLQWKHILIIAGSWAIGWLSMGFDYLPNNLEWGIMGLLGGSVTGLVVRSNIPSLQWKHIFIIAGGWTIGWLFSSYSDIFLPLEWFVVGLLGGGVMIWQIYLMQRAA